MVVSGITATYLGVCLLWEHLSRRADCDEVGRAIPVVKAWRSLVVIQLVLMGGAAYLYTYKMLGDAVVADNFALAEKRLDWNLEGLGPNNGLIAVMGSHGEVLFPLLPVAVRNGNYDLVKSLVKHGADLKPEDWNTIWALESETYVTNPLYFAVIDHDVKMIDFLLDLGANPDHGLYAAIMEHDRELAEYFLEMGASLEFALDVAKEKGYSQQRIDRLSADYAPKSKVDTDR